MPEFVAFQEKNRASKERGPVFVRYFGPVLDALRELGGSGAPDEVTERVANNLRIPDSMQNELLPSGQLKFRNKVAWARFYLSKEGLIDSSRRGVWSLTERGRATELTQQQAFDLFSKWHRHFQEQRRLQTETQDSAVEQASTTEKLEESVEHGSDYRSVVIGVLGQLSPAGFERFSQRL
jgi:restriction system protein